MTDCSHGSVRRSGLMLTTVIFLLLSARVSPSQGTNVDLYGPYLGQEQPGMEPRLFVPVDLRSNSEWWWHGAPAFSPDGREFYLDIYLPNEGIRVRIMEMSPADNLWTEPQVTEFADSFDTTSPSFTHDGSRIFFVSSRPDRFVWVSDRTSNGWSTPQPIEIPMPASLRYGWQVSADGNETLYMRMEDTQLDTGYDIYRIRKVDGSYLQPERLGANVNSEFTDLGAFIDPGGRFLIFGSDRPGGYGSNDLYISYRDRDGSWTPAVNLGEPINSSSYEGSPYVSPDGRFFFFLSDREQQHDFNPYWVESRVVPRHPGAPSPRRPSGRRGPMSGG